MPTIREMISDFFYLNESILSKHINNGIPFEEIYEVFTDLTKTRGQKKRFLYGLDKAKVNTTMKDNLWSRFIGDKGFVNTKLYDSSIKTTAEDIVGN